IFFFLFFCYVCYMLFHSFPTRRSSDLYFFNVGLTYYFTQEFFRQGKCTSFTITAASIKFSFFLYLASLFFTTRTFANKGMFLHLLECLLHVANSLRRIFYKRLNHFLDFIEKQFL